MPTIEYQGNDVKINGERLPKITASTAEPTTPSTNDLWIDTN